MVLKKVSKYAMTVTEQYNPNIKNRTRWTKPENAIGYVTNTVATAPISKEKYATHYKTEYKKDKNGKEVAKKVADKWDYKYKHPYTLSAHDFRLELPNNAKVAKITFEVRTKANKKGVILPAARFNIYGKAYQEQKDDTKQFGTGWNEGAYYYFPSKNHATTYSTETYEMDTAKVNTANADIAQYNKDVFGIDLVYRNVDVKGENYDAVVSVEWVKCTVEYYVPDCVLSLTCESYPDKGSEKNPATLLAGKDYVMDLALSNGSSIPYGKVKATLVFEEYTHRSNISISNGTSYNSSTHTWTVNLKGKAENHLKFYFNANKRGIGIITINLDNGRTYKYYYNIISYTSPAGEHTGFADIKVLPSEELHKLHRSCFNIVATGQSDDDNVTLNINPYNIDFVDLVLTDTCQNIKGIVSKSRDSISVKLDNAGDFVLVFNYCFYPLADFIDITITDTDDKFHPFFQRFDVLDSYSYRITSGNVTDGQYKIDFKTRPIKFTTHRIISDIETNSSIIELVSDEIDSNMVMGDCTIAMDKWEDLDYIGCIPLEHTHFEPTSTYKDTLINSNYKNKKYMGKKLASDEDIPLKVRLPPQQVTTLQGLIDMDKPIPINTNHKSFESDALNHRGWAEIYGVKTEFTNPRWYKCDIDVKYLTHNLNTRFKINKGQSVNDYEVPPIMTEVFSNGENLSDMDGDPFFIVDTDGAFYYNTESTTLTLPFTDDNDNTVTVSSNTSATYTIVYGETEYSFTGITALVEFLESRGYTINTPVVNQILKYTESIAVPVNERNNFSIDNGQHITITTAKPLSHTSTVNFEWSSALISEIKENAVSRIVRLLDNTNNPVFEYEYDNIQVIDDEVTADVIYRVRESYDEYIDYQERITFEYEPSTEVDSRYGSTLSLILNNGKLSIRDTGFNGKELAINDIQLEDSSYTYQVEWINNNDDDETNEIDGIFDFNVQDTVLSTTYADKFSNLIISPFPVADKKILFTRQAEEGTIYYYHDDGDEFSYLVEPYYQYHNGCDLVSEDGVSTVNLLNYGFEIVYIQNGLVRLGFNRLTGELYLAKYDTSSESYITVSRFHLSKFEDVNLNSIDDDKIEVQASDCIFTIYRGHPYIKVKHELEDIRIDTTYNTVWGEQVGSDDAQELPIYWDLMNNKNLLPIGVGGKIHSSDLIVTSEYVDDRIPTELHMGTLTTTEDGGTYPKFITGYTITATVTDGNGLSAYTDDIELDDSSCSFGLINWSESCDITIPSHMMINIPEITQSSETVQLYATVYNPCNQGVNGQIVVMSYDDGIDTTGWKISCTVDKTIIQTGDIVTYTVTVKDANNNPVENVFVGIYDNED